MKVLHHFRRNRNYSSNERLGIVSLLFALSVVASIGGWLLVSNASAQSSTWTVKSVEYPVVTTEGTEVQQAKVTLTDSEGTPAVGVWTGLKIKNPTLRSPQFTYQEWYSPSKDHAFFKTNAEGIVTFPLYSEVQGDISYDLYTTDRDLVKTGRFSDLDYSFTAQFK